MTLLTQLKRQLAFLFRPHRSIAVGLHQGVVLARRFAIGASLVSLFIYWLHPTLLERLDVRARDMAFQIRQAPPPPPDVVVVSVDEKSVKHHGRWPWPRATQAKLIKRLKTMGAKVIALDIIYGMPQDAENDRALANALKAPGAPVAGGYFFRMEQSIPPDAAAISLLRKNRISTLLEKPDARHDRVALYPFVETNHPALASGFSAFGYFNTIPDHDGLYRSTPLVLRYYNEYYPSLALQALAIGNRLPLALDIDRMGVAAIRLGEQRIPVDALGRLTLNYYSRENPVPLLSAADILDGTITADRIRDKLVFVGVTELGIADLRPTPIADSFPAVAFHATAAANIIQDFHLYRDNRTVLIDVLLMALLPMLMVWLMSKLDRPIFMATVFLTTSAIIWFIFYWLVTEYGLLISFFYPLVAVLLGYTVFEMYEILVIQRRQRYIRRAFSSYITHSLVTKMLNQPGEMNLKGENRHVTMLHSDIHGFTAISESLPPEILGKLLNHYLGAMTEILLKNNGMLDKYIFNSVLGIFNAPLNHPDHPREAARTAVAMQNAIDELNIHYREEFKITLQIGIGLHTDNVIIGNFGSPRRFNYTAVGRSVSIALQLERLTRTWGVGIVISEMTRQELDEEFLVRRLDSVRVKGMSKPLEIFQLFAGETINENRILAERFDEAMTDYLTGNWSQALKHFEALAISFPEDKPAQIYIKRCRDAIAHPPGEPGQLH